MINLLLTFYSIDSPGVILVLLIVFFGAIALITFLLRLFLPGIREKKGLIDEATAVQEELDRVLEHITDEEVLAQMQNEADDDETK
ncbi:MAG TPA: hypothetical protein VFD05_04855 [Bacilli bacterium]|nr:hypothetical protein [Bacilli bacterium]